jgi:hypothetical protein
MIVIGLFTAPMFFLHPKLLQLLGTDDNAIVPYG